MATHLINIQFHDQTLIAALVEGVPHVAMKPICENIGLKWNGQMERIKRHPVMSQGIRVIRIPSNGGEQQMLMLPLDYLNGWLFGVDASRVKPEIKPRLLDYQRECFKVLAKHFMPKRPYGLKRGKAENPDLLHVTPLELDALVQQRAAQLLEGEVVFKERGCPHYDAPLSLWDLQNRIGRSGWLTFPEYIRVEPSLRALAILLRALDRDGHDVAGAMVEYTGIKHMLETFYFQLDTLRRLFDSIDRRGINITFG